MTQKMTTAAATTAATAAAAAPPPPSSPSPPAAASATSPSRATIPKWAHAQWVWVEFDPRVLHPLRDHSCVPESQWAQVRRATGQGGRWLLLLLASPPPPLPCAKVSLTGSGSRGTCSLLMETKATLESTTRSPGRFSSPPLKASSSVLKAAKTTSAPVLSMFSMSTREGTSTVRSPSPPDETGLREWRHSRVERAEALGNERWLMWRKSSFFTDNTGGEKRTN